MIKDNLQRVRDEIARVCQEIGRNPSEITLVGVTKYSDAAKIKEAVEAGLRDIGENRVQEAQKKFPILDSLNVKVTRHLIGHLQSNKVKPALLYFDLIHSVDSFKLAVEIAKEAAKMNKTAEILLQVNIAEEAQKFGATKDEAAKLVDDVAQLAHLKICGFMTMAPFTEDKELIRTTFKGMRQLWEQLRKDFAGHERVSMKYLSMGMSQDYAIALEEGSNMLRIGTAIFKEDQG